MANPARSARLVFAWRLLRDRDGRRRNLNFSIDRSAWPPQPASIRTDARQTSIYLVILDFIDSLMDVTRYLKGWLNWS